MSPRRVNQRWMTMISFLLLTLIVPIAVDATELSGSDGLTIRTRVVGDALTRDESRPLLLAGFDQQVQIVWRVDDKGWFPIWELVLMVSGGTETRLSTAVPLPRHVYETALTIDVHRGTIAAEVVDTTDSKRLALGGAQVMPPPLPLRAVTDGELLAVSPRYEPIGMDWSIGVLDGSSFLTRSVIPSGVAAQAVVYLPGAADGELQLWLEQGEKRHLAGRSPLIGQKVVLPLLSEDLPLGASTAVLQYVRDSAIQEIGRQEIMIGQVEACLGSLAIAPDGSSLHSTFTVGPGSTVDGVELTLGARLVEKVWSPNVGAYVDGQEFTQTIDVRVPSGALSIPITLSVPPAESIGLWWVEFTLTSAPMLDLRLVVDSAFFTTRAPGEGTPSQDPIIRIGTYSMLGFQGWPEDPAAEQLGGPTDPRREQHFANVISSLGTDILAIQDGASMARMRAIAERLDLNLATIPTPTAYPGGVLSRFPILETRSFPVDSGKGARPFSRHAGASLLDVANTRLWVVSLDAHPHDEEVREEEASILGMEVDRLLQIAPNVVVTGCFAENAQGPLHEALKSRGFVSVTELMGSKQPTSAGTGREAIDHVYVSPSLAGSIRSSRVVDEPGFRLGVPGSGSWVNSDHLPVLVDLVWPW